MSGGAYDYKQYGIKEIIDEMKDQFRYWVDHLEDYPEEYENQEKIRKAYKDAIKYLNLAYIYSCHFDWWFSGDTGFETMLERIDKDVERISLKSLLIDRDGNVINPKEITDIQIKEKSIVVNTLYDVFVYILDREYNFGEFKTRKEAMKKLKEIALKM